MADADRELKNGWTTELIDISINGCVYTMLKSNLEAYKQRGLEKGHQVSKYEMEKIEQIMFSAFKKTCKCTTERIAQKWSYDELQKIKNENVMKMQLYIQDLLVSGQCPSPMPEQEQLIELRKTLQVQPE